MVGAAALDDENAKLRTDGNIGGEKEDVNDHPQCCQQIVSQPMILRIAFICSSSAFSALTQNGPPLQENQQ